MKFMCRLFWTLSITFWIPMIYAIRTSVPMIIYLFLTFFLAVSPLIAVFFAKYQDHDCLKGCKKIECVDVKCMRITTWIFTALIIPDDPIVFLANFVAFSIMMYTSEIMYLHPMLLLFGFHFYEVDTEEGAFAIVIKRGKIIRDPQHMDSDNLYRLSDCALIM